jgi:hypothetical protein
LILVNGTAGKSNGNANTSAAIKLLRGATNIYQIHEKLFYSYNIATRWEAFFNAAYLDEPATTSATTYKIQLASADNTASVWINDWANSTIIVMEIGA